MSLRRLCSVARDPVDAASIGVFRVLFGLLILGEAMRWLTHGWIDEYLLDPPLLFKYYGFEWVTPLPGIALYALFVLLAVFAALVAAGIFYRLASVGLLLIFGYVFLLNQAAYLNQYYLLLTLALLLCVVPADRAYSLLACIRRPLSAASVPRWSVWVLRLQFEVMLIYAGLVKINADWLAGQPLGLWFNELARSAPIAGSWLNVPGVNVVASHAVVVLHLVGAPLLLWRRTRFAVFVVYLAFHLANSVWLQIGLFPWLTLAGTLLFFDPDWPRDVAQRLGLPAGKVAVVLPRSQRTSTGPWIPGFLAIFFLAQVLVPLLHLLYPGNVAWTSEGHRFSWRMKLDDRRGSARFVVTEPATGRRWEIDPGDYLSSRQAQVMAVDPDMILQFAHYLAQAWYRDHGVSDVAVRAHVTCALNGRRPAPLVDPDLDLARVPRTWRHYDWILPQPPPLRAAPSGRP